jgi:uncharacterized glyoxalase superfamily protein PhnB
MKPTPPGWPRISSAVFYDDASAAIDFLCRAFGFEVRLKVEGEGGRIEHSELTFGDGLIGVSSAGDAGGKDWKAKMVSPRAAGGGNTQCVAVFVDDADAHCARARAAGARIFYEPATSDYGDDYWSDRSYGALDPEGHHWWFMQRLTTRGT